MPCFFIAVKSLVLSLEERPETCDTILAGSGLWHTYSFFGLGGAWYTYIIRMTLAVLAAAPEFSLK